MIARDSADFSASERARNELWVNPLSAALASAIGRTVRLALAGSDPLEWRLKEVHDEWFLAETRPGATVIAATAHLDWIDLDVVQAGERPDPVAPSLRGVLGELARRRTSVEFHQRLSNLRGRIHHIGADYVCVTRASGESRLLPLSTIAWVSLGVSDDA